MAFVKLDTGLIDSTLWFSPMQTRVFLTALLMATPYELAKPMQQIEIGSLEFTDFVVPPGWYGFVPAAGPGILHRAMVPLEEGMAALRALGAPDAESRSHDWDGRRLVRVDGGFIVLNFMAYRDRDNTAAVRMKRLRERKRVTGTGDAVTVKSDAVTRNALPAESRVQSAEEENIGAGAPRRRKPSTASRGQQILEIYNEKVAAIEGPLRPMRAKLAGKQRQRRIDLFLVLAKDRVASSMDQMPGASVDAVWAQWLGRYFDRAASDPFIAGTAPRGQGHTDWRASLDYVISESCFTRLVES